MNNGLNKTKLTTDDIEMVSFSNSNAGECTKLFNEWCRKNKGVELVDIQSVKAANGNNVYNTIYVLYKK